MNALERARRVVEQWDKYDRHKVNEYARELCSEEEQREPESVAIARELIATTQHFREFVSYAATCQDQNTTQWMRAFDDHINGVLQRVSPDTVFELQHGNRFVFRKLTKGTA